MLDDGIAWVELHRPEKRNAMNPRLNAEMVSVLLELDRDDGCGVLVLTGAGESFSAGMDLKEYFRDIDGQPAHVQRQGAPGRTNYWQWRRLLRTFPKPTIAMVNGWSISAAHLRRCAPATSRLPRTRRPSASPRSTGVSLQGASHVSRGLAETVGTRASHSSTS